MSSWAAFDQPLPYTVEQIGALIAHCRGGGPQDYIDNDHVLDLIVLGESFSRWNRARGQWVACAGWDKKQFNDIDYIAVTGVTVAFHQRWTKDFLIIDLKDGRTAVWPMVP